MRRCIIAILALTALACSAPTAPKPVKPKHDDTPISECRSGFVYATRADGTQGCEPL